MVLSKHTFCVWFMYEIADSILLTGSNDKTLIIWNVSQQNKSAMKVVRVIQNYGVARCMVHLRKNYLAISNPKDINIYEYDVNEEKDIKFNMIKALKGHTNWIYDMKAIKNDEDLFISCSEDNDIRLWNLVSGSCIKTLKGHKAGILSILTLSNEILVSTSNDMTIKFWDINQNECIKTIPLTGKGKYLTLISDSLIACCGEKIILIKI